jgi:hypothetical protein
MLSARDESDVLTGACQLRAEVTARTASAEDCYAHGASLIYTICYEKVVLK